LPKEKKIKLFTLRVSETDREEWEAVAKLHNLTVASLIRFLIRKEKIRLEGEDPQREPDL
jgi:hypothetical protein